MYYDLNILEGTGMQFRHAISGMQFVKHQFLIQISY